MTALMTNPRQIPALVSACDPVTLSITPSSVQALARPLRLDPKPFKGQKMTFAYCPGPASVILLKIKAIENYSANAGRLTRQREFCSRVKSS